MRKRARRRRDDDDDEVEVEQEVVEKDEGAKKLEKEIMSGRNYQSQVHNFKTVRR